jgi:hypothetical protein
MKSEVTNKIHGNKSYPFVYLKNLFTLLIGKQIWTHVLMFPYFINNLLKMNTQLI